MSNILLPGKFSPSRQEGRLGFKELVCNKQQSINAKALGC